MLKPEHGEFVICVKSYIRPAWVEDKLKAVRLAELLANDIRANYRAPTYLFEYISDEKRAEAARLEAARLASKPYQDKLNELKAKAEREGNFFLAPDNKLHVTKVPYSDQIAVVIGGFRTEAEAKKALELIRVKWEPPANKELLDLRAIEETDRKGTVIAVKQAYVSPYRQAFVVANPSIPKSKTAVQSGLDSFTIELNEGRPYNLLKTSKPWTLAVKTFSAPISLQGAKDESSIMGRSGSSTEILKRGAAQAEQLAEALRKMTDKDKKPLGLEAFVLHSRAGSLVTVGQYNSPDDENLLKTRKLLTSMNFTMSASANVPGHPLAPNDSFLSNNILPMPVPR